MKNKIFTFMGIFLLVLSATSYANDQVDAATSNEYVEDDRVVSEEELEEYLRKFEEEEALNANNQVTTEDVDVVAKEKAPRKAWKY